MISGIEGQVVERHKVEDFAGFLQYVWAIFPSLYSGFRERNYPGKENIVEVLGKMKGRKQEFDDVYGAVFPVLVLDPLKNEQRAWHLLSPVMEDYLDRFSQPANQYLPAEVNEKSRKDFMRLFLEGRDLFKDWKIISDSYKKKYSSELSYRSEPDEFGIKQKEARVKDLARKLENQELVGVGARESIENYAA